MNSDQERKHIILHVTMVDTSCLVTVGVAKAPAKTLLKEEKGSLVTKLLPT